MARRERTGKLGAARLARLLKRYGAPADEAVVVGPGVGLDAAAVAVEKGKLVLASDPVTYASEEIGTYAVHVNANDIFVSGAEPCWFLADILLPPDRGGQAERVFAQIHRACTELGIALIGGHTEITPDLPRPIVAGFMVGRAGGEGVLTAAGVRPGDAVVLTRGVAIEGTAVLAREFEGRLLAHFPKALVGRSKRFLKSPGLSVGREARIALRHEVHAMHDPTEGGLLNGLWEMSQASGLEMHLDLERVAVFPETAALCGHFGLDPLRLLASGALLIASPSRAAAGLLAALAAAGIGASVIASARKGPPGVHWRGGSLTGPVIDEMLKVLA